MVNDKHQQIVSSEHKKEYWDNIAKPSSSFISNTLEIFNKCGAICKRIPFAGNVIDSALLYDESGSVKKSIIRFSVNSISGFTDKFILIAFIFDIELGIWTYKMN